MSRVGSQGLSCTVWLTGLSGAGKSTIARALEQELLKLEIACSVLDGDELRKELNEDLGFSKDDRLENVRRTAHVAKIMLRHVHVVIVAVISPTRDGRELAREIIGAPFREIFVDAPISVCSSRDPKGLYGQARIGRIAQFTGVSDVYEPPLNPALRLRTDELSVDQAVEELKRLIHHPLEVS
ncbi:adenylyl-sulfate kinase [Caballeronia sp. GAOx1]|uniref:adenylyl-sulfate kinase n=1 Tax=Caballeronia sp. GAOx1 TaxID=2921761 RepID=UPI0020287BE7|nr:adenylyl-sulfate kinase [Caballeronia sp. GAOx1]